MARPLLDLADIVAAAAHRFTDHPPAWFTWLHLKVLVAVKRCRTAANGYKRRSNNRPRSAA
jgi:hypothetical protein